MLNKMDTKDVTDELEEVWMSSFHSLPVNIRSDGGPCFTSAAWAEWCEKHNIESTIGTAYHSQGQAKVEARMYYIASALKAMHGGRAQGDWNYQSTLPKLEFAINTTFCEAVGGAPSWVFLGREPRTALSSATSVDVVDTKYKIDDDVTLTDAGIEEIRNCIAEHHTRINAVQGLASVAACLAGMESKKRYDSTHALAQIDVGDVVGVAVTPLNNMLPYITGPYVATEIDITRNFVSGHGWIDKEAKMAKVHVSRVFKMDMSRTDKKEYVAFTAPSGVAVPDEVVAHRTEKGRRVY
jgi:hypothetical protein